MADFSLSVGAGDAGGGNQHGANCSGSVWEDGTNAGGNYSTVKWSISASYYCRENYTWGGSTRSNAGYLDMVINDDIVGTVTMSITNGWGNGANIGSASGSIRISHDSSGNGSCKAYIRVRTGTDNRNYGVVYNAGQSGVQIIPFSSIGRASQPSINTWPNNSPDITCGQACTVHMNQGNTPFTHTISWSFGKLSDQTSGFAKTSGIQTNVQWTPPTSMMAQIPNSKSGAGTIKLTTWNGSENIGTKYCNFTLWQPSGSAPTISSVTYAENGTLPDGTKLTAHGVGTTTVIGQISKKVITITGSAKYSSSISKITCSHNGSTQTATKNGASFTFNYPVNTGSSKSAFSWTVTDSRGNSTSGSTSMTFVNYFKPVVSSATATRDGATVSTAKLSGKGLFFNGTVGSIGNDLTVTYTYNSAAHTATETKSGNNWSFSGAGLTGVDPNGNYSITVKVVDTIGYSSSKTIVLPKAVPTLWIGKTTVRANDYFIVNKSAKVSSDMTVSNNLNVSNTATAKNATVTGTLTIDGKTLLNRTYPVGAIYMSVNSTSPATLFGGTWAAIGQGRMLMGAGNDSYTAGSTGGSASHSHDYGVQRLSYYGASVGNDENGVEIRDYSSSTTPWKGMAFTNNTPKTLINTALSTSTESKGAGQYRVTAKTSTTSNLPPYLVVYMWKRTA